MAVFTITTFLAFADLLVAAGKLATDPGILNKGKALADLAINGKGLTAALRDAGLSPLTKQLAREAEEHALHFTHPGRARDDAVAVFWQVAPAAFDDPSSLVAAVLDPDVATDRMVAAIKASPNARDFTQLAEQYFRAVAHRTLAVMLADPGFISSATPHLWRGTLRRQGIQLELLQSVKDDTAEILALVRELHRIKETTVPEETLIAMARKIGPHVADRADTLRELDNAADIAAEMQARGEAGSNVEDFVGPVLRRLAVLTAEGRLDEAATAADAAVDHAEAGMIQLLDAAVNQHLLAYDAEGAARQIVKRVMLDSPSHSGLFDALRREQEVWYGRGHDKGLRLDLEVAIALARRNLMSAGCPVQRGLALDDLGTALAVLGGRESRTARLEEAVEVFRAELKEYSRERTPLSWAGAQVNLGTALLSLGERESGTAQLEEAVAAYRAALSERTRKRTPLGWALVQNNLGTALAKLGERKRKSAWLKKGIAAFHAALGERTRERVPLDWARTQVNLATALAQLGKQEGDKARLEEAVAACRLALGEYTRERVPLDWALAQHNLGRTLQELGEREDNAARLEEAVQAYRGALGEFTRERVPLQWAATQHDLGTALSSLGKQESGTARLEEAVAVFRAALKEYTHEREPLNWAMSTGNQGIALWALAARTEDLAMARRALDQIAAAEATMREEGHLHAADEYDVLIGAVEVLVERLAVTACGT